MHLGSSFQSLGSLCFSFLHLHTDARHSIPRMVIAESTSVLSQLQEVAHIINKHDLYWCVRVCARVSMLMRTLNSLSGVFEL